MPRMKDVDLDVEYLDEVEYDDEQRFVPYDGPQPRKNEYLNGNAVRAWWTKSKAGDAMLKVIFQCTEGKYEGWERWDNITFNDRGKWKWKPFLDAFGLTLVQIRKSLARNYKEEDNVGLVVDKIADVEFGEDSADCRVLVGLDDRDEANVNRWLPYRDPDDEDDEEEDEDDEEVEEEEDDEEEDEEPAPRRHSARKPAARKPAAKARPTRTAAKSGASSRSGAATTRRPKAATSRTTKGKTSSKRRRDDDDEYDDDPPF